MKKLISKLKQYRNRKRYEVILNDRQHLTDYERNQLIPELKCRLSILKEYFNEVINLCDIQKNSEVFNQAVFSVINPNNFESDPHNPKEAPAEKFFNGIKEVAQTQGVDDIDEVLKKYSTIENIKQLGLFLTEVNNFCSALVVINNNLFLYKIETYPYLTNVKTGQIMATHPPQYTITIEPFQILVTNIVGVSKATSETIHEWHKYALKLKVQYLDLYTTKFSINIHILTIILAVSLSAFFLVASDPFNLFKENRKLKSEIVTLKEELSSLTTMHDGTKRYR
jgi:hypothetical protein